MIRKSKQWLMCNTTVEERQLVKEEIPFMAYVVMLQPLHQY